MLLVIHLKLLHLKFTRDTFKQYKQYVGKTPIIICSKGFEKETMKTLDEVILDELPEARVGALSGPSHAEEVSIAIPTVLVMASKDKEVRELVQDAFMCSHMRVYTSEDIKGVELGGALKNIIAFCAGVSAGVTCKIKSAPSITSLKSVEHIIPCGKVKFGKNLHFFSLLIKSLSSSKNDHIFTLCPIFAKCVAKATPQLPLPIIAILFIIFHSLLLYLGF